MATLSENDLNELRPFMPVLEMFEQHDIYIGCDIHAFKAIYDRMANENLNTGCGACISTAFRRTSDLIKEYELDNRKGLE